MQSHQFVESNSWGMKIWQQRTLMPRLAFSNDLLQDILVGLKIEKSKLSQNNEMLTDLDRYTKSELEFIEREKILSLAVFALTKIQKQLGSLNHVNMVPQIIPSSIPSIRGISSQLNELYPDFSYQLCELSSVLGSVLIDSASILEAKFDFRQSNLDSAILLDEAKLIVDSKLDKLYPNLDSFRAQIT